MTIRPPRFNIRNGVVCLNFSKTIIVLYDDSILREATEKKKKKEYREQTFYLFRIRGDFCFLCLKRIRLTLDFVRSDTHVHNTRKKKKKYCFNFKFFQVGFIFLRVIILLNFF